LFRTSAFFGGELSTPARFARISRTIDLDDPTTVTQALVGCSTTRIFARGTHQLPGKCQIASPSRRDSKAIGPNEIADQFKSRRGERVVDLAAEDRRGSRADGTAILYYIICPDSDVTAVFDNRRILWRGGHHPQPPAAVAP
jgi:hypothetical protein